MSLAKNNDVNEDPWDYFIQPSTTNNQKTNIQTWPKYWNKKVNESILVQESFCLWFYQLAEVGFQKFKFQTKDLKIVHFTFHFSLFSFSMRLEKSEEFPYTKPKYECDFQSNFKYNWIFKR